VETDELYAPLYIGVPSVHGIVVQTEHLSHFIEELGAVDFSSRQAYDTSVVGP
jgi:hypothetical protein